LYLVKRKWNEKNKESKFKKGIFSEEEIRILVKTLCEYALQNTLDNDELVNLIVEKQVKKEGGIWPLISESLPHRSVQSVHNICHRLFNPNNYKGEWNVSEEEQIIR
jgi:hypothetical protein